jgi:hypothetical protein
MTSQSSNLLAFSLTERLLVRDHSAVHGSPPARIATVNASHAPFPLHADSPLQALLRPGVSIELYDGCANVRVTGLNRTEHDAIVHALLKSDELSDDELWLSAALVRATVSAKGALGVVAGHLRFVAAGHGGARERTLESLEHAFIPYGEVSRRDGDHLTQTLLHVVRETLLTRKVLVWFCGLHSVFTFDGDSGPRFRDELVRERYRAWLRDSSLFVDKPEGFVHRDGAPIGILVLSDQSGVAARGQAVIERFLARSAGLARVDLPRLGARSEVLTLGEFEGETAPGVVLIDAAALDFSEALLARLVRLCRVAASPQLQAISVTRSAGIGAAELRRVLEACGDRVRLVLVDEALFLQLSASERRTVLPASIARANCGSDYEHTLLSARVAAALSFWAQAFTFPSTEEEIAADAAALAAAEALLFG